MCFVFFHKIPVLVVAITDGDDQHPVKNSRFWSPQKCLQCEKSASDVFVVHRNAGCLHLLVSLERDLEKFCQ